MRRRVLWVVLACLLAPVALYALLPIAAATGLTYFLHQQGTTTLLCNWDIQDGTRTCLSSRSRGLDGESLSVTVQDSRLQYDLEALFSGRVHRLIIPDASVILRRRGGAMARHVGNPRR